MNLHEALALAVEKIEIGSFADAELICNAILDLYPEDKPTLLIKSLVGGASGAEILGTPGEKSLLNFFKKYHSHYGAIPDYNLNWAIKDFDPIHEFLGSNPLILIDVGARGASLGEVENLKKYCCYYGFDADASECKRVNENPPKDFHQLKMLPYYIGKLDGDRVDFNLYKARGQSSRFLPSEKFIKLFDPMEVENTVSLKSTTLDTILGNEGIEAFDFIKLDTQGTELEILSGSPKTLGKALLVEAEIEFCEMYNGQPLFGEFFSFMMEKGFDLLYINRVFQNRVAYNRPSRGQITFCDALFARRDEDYSGYDHVSLAKHAILLINYGHLDIAHEIWAGFKSVKDMLPNLGNYFKEYPSDSNRYLNMSRDKLIAWALHQRKNNQLPFDSDRSWPFR